MYKSIVSFFIDRFTKSETVGILNEDLNLGVYFINDPFSPDLIEEQFHCPPVPNLAFVVAGYDAAQCNKKENHAISQAINCNMTLCRTIGYFNRIYGGFNPMVKKWAASRRLTVFPRAGKDFNAFYDRSALKFFSDAHPKTKNIVYSVDSADIVSHEAGHGILDSIRPDFWNVQTKEGWAFHEAFSDIQAIVTTSQSEILFRKAMQETGGNLKTSNCISRLAEQFGEALYQDRKPPYLRDSSIVYKYQKPETLPDNAPSDKLSSECHSFSRIFSGAWYNCVVEIFEIIRKEKEDFQAWTEAKDICYLYLLKAIKSVPNTTRLFDALAKMILIADQENGSKYQEVLRKVFTERKILIYRIKMLSDKKIDDVKKGLNKSFMSLKKTENFSYASVLKKRTLKLSDYLISAQSSSDPIYSTEIEVANDSIYIFDKDQNLVDEICEDENETIDAAANCVASIVDQKMLNKIWKIENNKLIRNRIDCGFCAYL